MNELEIHDPIKFSQIVSKFSPTKEILGQRGIYLWAVRTNEGYLVHYIGETGASFSSRLRSHLNSWRSGKYRIYDPIEFVQGKKKLLWTPYVNGAELGQNYLVKFERIKHDPKIKLDEYIGLFEIFLINFR